MKWNFYEMRMLRLVINHARLDNGMPARKGTDGDLMVKEWLADRGDARLRPTEEYVCIAARHIRDHRDSMPQYTSVEIKRWDALLEKLCDEPVPLIERIHESFRPSALGIDAELELDDGTYLVATPDDDPNLDYDDPDSAKAAQEAIEDGDAFGVIHFGHDAEEIDSLWGMIGYGGGFKAIYGYIEQQGWKINPQTNKYMTDRAPTVPPTVPTVPVTVEPELPKTFPGVPAPLTPKEEGVIDSMLRLGWYTERKAAVAHILRMRESGRVTGLEDISMVEAARYHPSLMRLPSWGGR